LLLLGLATPIVGAFVAFGGIGVVSSVLPSCTHPQFTSGISLIFAAAILMAIIILGPGALSLDARLFGRREIIIPRKSNS
jgi:amino acid transporter